MKRYLSFAIQSILHRKLRSWLTVVGIIIGIAAIVTLITSSQGLENAITYEFEKIGSNRIYVFPKTGAGILGAAQGVAGLTNDDINFLEGFSEFDYVNPYLYERATIFFGKEEIYSSIIGVDEEDNDKKLSGMGITLADGNWLQKNGNGLLIGWDVANRLFDKNVYVGNKLEIGGKKYSIVGILSQIGNEQDDSSIYMVMDEARDIFDKPDEVSFIDLVVKDDLNVNEVAEKLFTKLKRYHGEEDFEIYTPEQLLVQFNVLLNIVQVVLGAIAAISLLVGGIGIMNSMYTNVLERKTEIGVMKSIGAGPKDIQKIFLIEAGMIGLAGGIMGVLLGTLASFGIGLIAKYFGFMYLRIQVEWWLLVLGILFAFIVGMLSGYFPARQASKLLPVEALRE